MGASQATATEPPALSRSQSIPPPLSPTSTSRQQTDVPPPSLVPPSCLNTSGSKSLSLTSSNRHHTDGPSSPLIPPSRLKAPGVKYLQSLDRNMKVFLRVSNLPGLEYRLKLAGYRRLDDLLRTDRETLMARGFTGIMAQQLITAVTEYINRQFCRSEEEQLPFRLVRKGQRIQTEPTEGMKENPNFHKPNIKRQKSFEGPLHQRAVKRGQNHTPATRGEIAPLAPKTQTPSLVRLMSEEDLELQHLLSPPPVADPSGSISPEEGWGRVLGIIVESPFVEEEREEGESDFSADETDSPTAIEFGTRIQRSFSIPADFKWLLTGTSPGYPVYRVRCYSSPPNVTALFTLSVLSIASILDQLQRTQDINGIFSSLCLLLQRCRRSACAWEVRCLGGLGVVVRSLQRHCEVLKIADVCCRLLQYLSRAVPNKLGDAPNEREAEEGGIPRAALSAVCLSLDWHPTSRRFLTQALLATGSLCGTDVYQCHVLLCQGGLESVARTMETLADDSRIQVAAMSTLAIALAHIPDGRLQLLLQHGHILDLVLHAMTAFPQDSQVQLYACSFLALLVTVVSVQIESGVMQLIVEHVAIAMETMSHDPDTVHWGCKVLAHAASNAALSEWKLAGRCCELLSEAMRTFPHLSSLQTWAAYALHQLAAYHRVRVCDHLLSSDLASLQEPRAPSLSAEACSYLYHLGRLVREHRADQQRLSFHSH